MAKKLNKTNAARLLDGAKINYKLIPYQVDENNLAATHVAEQLGEDINRVFKTLVLRGDKTGFFVCVIPGDKHLDLKKAAKVSSNKNAEMILMKDLLATTGYIRGACSPIGMRKPFPTFFHSTCTDFPSIYVSAGIRGMQIEISATELVKYIGASICDLL